MVSFVDNATRTEETIMNHPFTYAELHTANPEEAARFYQSLFGWGMTHHDLPNGRYTSIATGEGPEGGLMGQSPFDGGVSQWLPYVAVPDVDAASRRAVELGARLKVERTEVPDMGWFTWLEDPTGARFALWQKK
jgi:predicted enzyme related to lactoylglutathione lyase